MADGLHLNLTFLDNDPLNMVVTCGGQPIYEVVTPSKFIHDCTTTITYIDKSFHRPVASIDWNSTWSTIVHISGLKIPLERFLLRTAMFSNSRTFYSFKGHRYKWEKSQSLMLYDSRRTVVARLHRATPHQKAFLEIMRSELEEVLDEVLVSCVIMAKDARLIRPVDNWHLHRRSCG
ncbi:hypothetical protein BD410DRAFT_784387 [Rickenella mellea]|uniref:DUF6593 domain-containing protein n=1 Tax=Rickenella mellea TaxID=50990 RepID=A0A4Y7QFV4_9AGAM|nr:hypothetical protein BD410DRAFT_784387 [Rickenella mellea]